MFPFSQEILRNIKIKREKFKKKSFEWKGMDVSVE